MRIFFTLTIAIALCAAVGSAQKSSPLSDSELAAITARGQMLAEYDAASWHATDAVQALKPADGAVARYIARKTDDRWVVVFGRMSEAKDGFLIVYEATQAGPRQFSVQTNDPPRKDTGYFYAAAKAIDLALENAQLAKRPYNTYVLPGDSQQLYVYVSRPRRWQILTRLEVTLDSWWRKMVPKSLKHAHYISRFSR